MMRISASEQVAAWIRALPPLTKHRVRIAIRALARNRGDIKALQGSLEGFNRLRIGGLRIIYRQSDRDTISLEFANTRDVVYEMYEQFLSHRRDSD